MNKGFTLIELLIVIVILGLMAAIAISALNPVEARNRGWDTVLLRDTSELYNSIERYKTAKGNYPWTSTPAEGTFLSQAVLQELISNGDLKPEFRNRNSLTNILIYFDTDTNFYLCFYPQSKFYLDQTGFLFKKVYAAGAFSQGKICFPK